MTAVFFFALAVFFAALWAQARTELVAQRQLYERRWAEEQQLQRHRHAIVILRSRFPLSERMN